MSIAASATLLNLAASLIIGVLLAVQNRRLRRDLQAGDAPLPGAQEAEQAALRRMRIAAHDLRSIGMTLHGNAGHLAANGLPHAAGIATAATDVFEMADDLHEYTMQAGSTRVLHDEEIHLGVAIDEAVTNVGTGIGPGRRQWRIAPDVRATRLSADRRALRHVLRRALTVAVRNTGHDDSIDISLRPTTDGVAVVIEDGFRAPRPPAAAAGPVPTHDSRGIGLRLTLVRALMEAHGGGVETAAAEEAGTYISLAFPRARVLEAPIDHQHASRPTPARLRAITATAA
ncbi:sensor histidine kinase [Limobrevibacterium gyesilva]|uniref:Histidine kinase domain-containing protein n=1 Tax=Limobrevibacterium gyesilva TaxID=2991712 RepID=A0AA42CF98_9PROT|nr:ATP-binding protein [Limobrevibacterium gyesilva]MCW3474556.1 hypothetical protein [Limobrevibacterium gyesilva]